MGLQKGSLVAGRYRAERCVGAGGMGEVWEGEHVTLGSRVAIKTLLAGGEDNPELVARFRRDAELFLTFTCDDFEQTWSQIEKSPVNARWQEAMKPYFAPMAERRPGERFPMWQEVFYLE